MGPYIVCIGFIFGYDLIIVSFMTLEIIIHNNTTPADIVTIINTIYNYFLDTNICKTNNIKHKIVMMLVNTTSGLHNTVDANCRWHHVCLDAIIFV
jgi:hypothetical protein